MPKNNINPNNPDTTKGERISGRKASSERYIPFYEFLLFDPKYRELSDKAKILYSFLRSKSVYSERKTEEYERLIADCTTKEELEAVKKLKGIRSYKDENGEIFIIADNTELSVVIGCHVNRVPTYKKELMEFGLLDEVKRFRKSSHLYILLPQDISDSWMYIEEMKEKREAISNLNTEKYNKYTKGKSRKKSNSQNVSCNNSQNVSCNNSQNVSYNNSQKVRQIYFKSIKGTYKVVKSTEKEKNLSIKEINKNIEKAELPISIKKVLNTKIDRLIEYNLDVFEIEIHYKSIEDTINAPEYSYVLMNLLDKIQVKPKSFSAVMNNWIKRNREHKVIDETKDNQPSNPIRKEIVPDWLKKQKEKQKENNSQSNDSPETDQEVFQERVKALKQKLAKKYG